MDVRRDVIERLEATGVGYFVTGSEALAIHGLAYRATNDIDIVLDIDPTGYETRVRPAFEPDYLVNPLVRMTGKWLGSAIHVEAVGKADFVVRDADPWGLAALDRRLRRHDEALGDLWVSTIEDLLIAKLEFAAGSLDGLQGRDCVRIVQGMPALDRPYVRMHAASMGLDGLLAEVTGRAG